MILGSNKDFDISKIKIFEKNILTGNYLCDLKISSVKIF